MRKCILLLVAVLLLSVSPIWAAPVDVAQAHRIATVFMQAHGMSKVDQLVDVSSSLPFTAFYVFASSEGGFVVVSADDCVVPILGYSATAVFPTDGTLPDHVSEWLAGYQWQIDHDRRTLRMGSDWVAEQWQLLLGGEVPSTTYASPVSPLVATRWNQSPRYNNLCPYDNDYSARTVTGCVATATAQIMKYWNHPATGYGSHHYTATNSHTNYGTLSANFGSTNYQWSAMPNALSSGSSAAEINAVATLMYHIGVADEMTYDVSANGGSGAHNYQSFGLITPSSEHSLMAYFKYRPNIATILRSDYSPEDYCALLRAELDQHRPILYSGSNTEAGHSFVLDGYDADGLFHINWGWGGAYDGHFVMGSLNPGVGGIGGNSSGTYNVRNVAMLGIQPNDDWSATTPTTVTVARSGGSSACSVEGAGTYSFGDTVTLHATAAPGYRFDGWGDGSKFNDRQFIANGGNYSFTAHFAPIEGDTLYYCPGGCVSGFGGSNSLYWGIKLPTSLTDPAKSLTAVQLFVRTAGTYRLTVYTGANRSTTAYTTSATFTADDIDSWRTIPVATPVEATSDIWITFHTTGLSYPVSYSHGSGVAGSFLYGSDFTDYSFDYGISAMIRGIFTNMSLPAPGINSDCLITSFPFTMDFEGSMVCWSFNDANHDGITWAVSSTAGYGNSRCAAITYAHNADDYLTSPSIATAGRYSITWKARTRHSSYPETYQLWAVGRDTSIKIFEETLTEHTSFVDRLATFNVAPADTVQLRFRYISDNKYEFYVDNITVNLLARQFLVEATSDDVAHGTVQGSGVYDSTATVTLTATPTRRFHFLQWSDGDATNPRQFSVVQDTHLVAIFEADPPLRFTVNASPATAYCGIVSGAGVYFEDSIATLTAQPAYGYHFQRWNDGDTTNPRQLRVVSDTAFTAFFSYDTSATFNIIARSADTNMGTVVGSGTYHSGSMATLVASPKQGFQLQQWSDGSTEEVHAVIVSHTTTYMAIFAPVPRPAFFTLVLRSADSLMGSVVGAGRYVSDTSLTIRAIANPGYRFVHWSDGSTLATRTLLLSSDSTLTAYFEIETPAYYMLTVSSMNALMGTASGSGQYTAGSIATLVALPNQGYYFVRWDDGSTQAQRSVVVNANATYTAIFERIVYTLSVSSNNPLMGTVSGGGTYDSGTVVLITAVATSGHHFVSWNDGDTTASRSILLTSDTAFTATFARTLPRYTLTLHSSDTLKGIVDGAGVYDSGAVVLVNAIATEGNHFVAWSDGDTTSSRTLTLTSDTSLTATFEANNQGISTVVAPVLGVYPNPASSEATLSWNFDGDATLSVLTVSGSHIATYSTSASSLVLDLSAYARGVYFVSVATSKAAATAKLIVR